MTQVTALRIDWQNEDAYDEIEIEVRSVRDLLEFVKGIEQDGRDIDTVRIVFGTRSRGN